MTLSKDFRNEIKFQVERDSVYFEHRRAMVPISFNSELHMLIIAIVRFWRYFVYQANGNFGVPIHSPPNQPQQPMPGKHPFFAPGQQWPPQQQQQPVQSVPAPPIPSPSAPASAKQPQQQQKQQQKQPTQSLAQKNYVLPSGQVSQRKRKISAPRDGYESSDCGCCEKKNSKKVKVLADSTVWVVGDSDEENIDSCSDSCSSDD